jgi:hypothetical protein
MKIKFLMAGLLGLISTTSFAQKGELNNAQTEYESYQTVRGQKLLAAKATTSLTNAKTSIDKAAANEKTANLPQTFALKGAIYSSLALQDTVEATSAPLFTTADEALKKAKELDTKNEFKKTIDDGYLNLAIYSSNNGVKQYQSGKYDLAYKSFNYYRMVRPDDTTAIYYTGLSAVNAAQKDPKFYPLAIENYNKLVTTNYSKKETIYNDLSILYLSSHDTANAVKILDAGLAKYPKSTGMMYRQIDLSLHSGKQEEELAKLDAAIANDPKNKLLYFYAGLAHSQIADGLNNQQSKLKDKAAKAALEPKKLENYQKASEMYKKAIEIDPGFYEANLNAGISLFAPAIDAYTAANQLPQGSKAYPAELAKAKALSENAKPYLLKAAELKPTSRDALIYLNNYYRINNDKANIDATQKKMDALK